MPDIYGDLAGFKAWADARGHSYPEGSGADAEIDAALLRGTEYLRRYTGRWKGIKAATDQPLAWPRKGVRDEDGILLPDDEVPVLVIHAAYEATRRFLAGDDLQPDLARGGAVSRERVKAGPVEAEEEFRDDAPARTAVTSIDDLLAGLLRSTNAVWLERV